MHPAPDVIADLPLSVPGARWHAELGEFILNWDDVRTAEDPHATAVEFAREVFSHACAICNWDPSLAASAHGTPPPIH